MLQFVKESLDCVALFVECPVAGMRSAPVVSRRDDRDRASIQDRIVEMFSVIGSVGDDGLAGDVLDQGRGIQNITAMTRAGDQADGITEAVGCRVEFGAKASFGPTKTLGIRPPFSVRAPLAC